jgi:hypothetical protein
VLWRRKYLRQIKQFRAEGRTIYYLDETWVNACHTIQKVLKDQTVGSRKEAFLRGLSTGLQNPAGKGKRLILLHIGSDKGFVNSGKLVLESVKKQPRHWPSFEPRTSQIRSKSVNHSTTAWCWTPVDCYINVQESPELEVDSKRKREWGGLETDGNEGYRSNKLEDELGKVTPRK